MFATFAKKFGEAMLGEFKVAIIDRLSRVETKIDRIETDLSEVKSDVKNLQYRVGRLEAATTEMQSILKVAGAPIHQPILITPGSPLKLTEEGETLVKKIDGYEFIKNNKTFFISLLEKENPRTAYDVQEMAKKVLLDSVTHPISDPLKMYAYETGNSLENLIAVLGIILRDTYLEQHSHIKS